VIRVVVSAAVVAAVVTGCGDDGGGADREVVQLLEDERDLPTPVAECIADRLVDDDQVDLDELEAIVRGEGSTDVVTADAYTAAVDACDQGEDQSTETSDPTS
jgi:hypothetical protein